MQATNFRLGANQIKGEPAHRIHKSEKQVFQYFETVPQLSVLKIMSHWPGPIGVKNFLPYPISDTVEIIIFKMEMCLHVKIKIKINPRCSTLKTSIAWFLWIRLKVWLVTRFDRVSYAISKTSPHRFLFQSSSLPTILFTRDTFFYFQRFFQTKKVKQKNKKNAIHYFHAELGWEIVTEGGCTYATF